MKSEPCCTLKCPNPRAVDVSFGAYGPKDELELVAVIVE
jgi:hypothetical protein